MKRPLLIALSVVVLGNLAGFRQSAATVGTRRWWTSASSAKRPGASSSPEGKEVDAIYGDIVLRNSMLTAVIAQTKSTRHANMTVRDVSGCLIDLTAQPGQSDQLAAYYPGRKGVGYQTAQIIVQNKALPAE